MGRNSIVISCVLTQSDISNEHVHACLGMLATMPDRLKNAWHPVAKIYERFKEEMKEGI